MYVCFFEKSLVLRKEAEANVSSHVKVLSCEVFSQHVGALSLSHSV